MNSLARARNVKTFGGTLLSEQNTETVWQGGSNVDLLRLIEQAEKKPLYEHEHSYDDNMVGDVKRSMIAERIEKVVENIPEISFNDDDITERFLALQEWEGVVLEIHGDVFTAHLNDITCKDNPPEMGNFIVEDIRKDDLKLMREGAVFRWIIGYEIKKSGNKRRSSQLVFRRLPLWSKREIDEADREAQQLMESIPWE